MASDDFRKTFGHDANRMVVVDEIARRLGQYLGNHLEEMTRCCVNCVHWRQGPPERPIEQCGLANARPPARVIAFGCEKYEDEIPF